MPIKTLKAVEPFIEFITEEPRNIKGLYKYIFQWLEEEGYLEEVGGGKDLEVFYSEQNRGGAIEYHIWWRCWKPFGGSKVFAFRMDMDYLGLGIKKGQEMLVGGKKIKTDTGEINIKIHPTIEIDYADKWKKHWLMKHQWIQNLFIKRLYKKEIDEMYTEILSEAYRLLAGMKAFCGITEVREEKPLFHPERVFK